MKNPILEFRYLNSKDIILFCCDMWVFLRYFPRFQLSDMLNNHSVSLEKALSLLSIKNRIFVLMLLELHRKRGAQIELERPVWTLCSFYDF